MPDQAQPPAPPELRALAAILPGWWATTVGLHGERGRCIEACRVAVAVLRRLKVECRAVACDVDAANAAALPLIEAGAPLSAWPAAARAITVRCDAPSSGANFDEPTRRKGFAGHLAIVGGDWFADLTAPQFHRPQHGIHVPAAVVGPYLPDDPGVSYALPDGGMIRWLWRPEVAAWRTTPAWRQDIAREHLDFMCATVTRRMEG